MLSECNGCEYQCNLSHIDICTLGSPCPNQRSTPMTNEEWIKSCSTEELAEWLSNYFGCIGCPARKNNCRYENCKEALVLWLKEQKND